MSNESLPQWGRALPGRLNQASAPTIFERNRQLLARDLQSVEEAFEASLQIEVKRGLVRRGYKSVPAGFRVVLITSGIARVSYPGEDRLIVGSALRTDRRWKGEISLRVFDPENFRHLVLEPAHAGLDQIILRGEEILKVA